MLQNTTNTSSFAVLESPFQTFTLCNVQIDYLLIYHLNLQTAVMECWKKSSYNSLHSGIANFIVNANKFLVILLTIRYQLCTYYTLRLCLFLARKEDDHRAAEMGGRVDPTRQNALRSDAHRGVVRPIQITVHAQKRNHEGHVSAVPWPTVHEEKPGRRPVVPILRRRR